MRNRCTFARHRTPLLAFLLALVGVVASARAASYRGRALADVLLELQAAGLSLVFSSAVVDDLLQVTVEPVADEPRALLDEILAPLGLEARSGPGDTLLILPATPPPGRLAGRVLARPGSAPIPGASVRVRGTDRAGVTDGSGEYLLTDLQPGAYTVAVSARGFVAITVAEVSIRPGSESALTVALDPQPTFVTEVNVTPSRHSVVLEEPAAPYAVSYDEARLTPAVGGDTSRVLKLLPGVTAPDNSAAFHVRGSSARDVSVILDGLELYDPFHLTSLQSPFSVIDSNLVDRIDLFGGGFTADLGDRHGGFVEIATLSPSATSRGEIELGSVNSRLTYRAPLERSSGSWLLSARGWYPNAIRDTTEIGRGDGLKPRFGDLYTKLGFPVGGRHQLSAHGLLVYDQLTYHESDEVRVNESVDARSRNGYVWLRALSAWSASLGSETVLSAGRIERGRNGVAGDDFPISVTDDRSVNFFELKHDATLQIGDGRAIKAGTVVRELRARYRYSERQPDHSTSLELAPHGTSIGLYAAYRARLATALAAEVGVRWDGQSQTEDAQLSPRVNAVWQLTERSELRLALGRYHQSQRIHELQVEDGITELGRSEVADEAELSFHHRLSSGLRVRVDAYHRRVSHLVPRYENLFEPIELFPETSSDRVRIAPDAARLRGLELLLRGNEESRLLWWLSYALAAADDIEDGRAVPRSWDQRHEGKLLLGYHGERWSLSLTGSAHSGWPTTPVSGRQTPAGIEPIVGQRNAERLPAYARVDVKAGRSFGLPHGRLSLHLQVLNLTDRDNACCVNEFLFEPRADGTVATRRDLDRWLGITPSVSVQWDF